MFDRRSLPHVATPLLHSTFLLHRLCCPPPPTFCIVGFLSHYRNFHLLMIPCTLMKKIIIKRHHNHIQTLTPSSAPYLPQARIGHPSTSSQSDCAGTIVDLPASLHKLSNLPWDMDHDPLKEPLHDWSTNWQTRTCTPGLFSSLPESIRPLQTIS